ncbi:MAG: hypothetical protein ACK52I_29580 [Pseudomonadota bacterium]|jgi:hypothetical protein
MRINWTEDEITLLKKLWWDHTPDEVAALFPGRTKKSVTLKACKLKLKRSCEATARMHARGPRVWTKAEVDLLRRLWWDHIPKEVFDILKHIPQSSIYGMVRRSGIKRSAETSARIMENKKKLLYTRNTTILGRERNYESAKDAASRYKTRTEFYRKDISMYLYIKDNGLWDELCSHMALGNFNYSESFLYECVRCLFPGEAIIRNSRRAIKPYELDIYLPKKKIAFEYDGSNWHNAEDVRMRDEAKAAKCEAQGISLFRIKEIRQERNYPENFIIASLANFGFNVTQIDADLCSKQAFDVGYTESNIREVVSKYTTLKDFRRKEAYLYALLCRRKLTDKYLGGLQRRITDNSPEAITLALSQVSSAKEFRENHPGKYQVIKKNPKKYAAQLFIYESMRAYGHERDYTPKSKREVKGL